MRMDRRVMPVRRGQVLAVMLLAIVLLVGLIFYVMNIGDQINRRAAAQDAADSAAISGAVHMARGMNTVAMNNISMSRMLSLVPVMDSMPLSIQISREELEEWERGLSDQLSRQDTFPSDAMRQPMIDGLRKMQERLGGQRDVLAPLDDLFNGGGLDMATKTYYQLPGQGGPPPHGSFWVAARHLDQFSEATLTSAGVQAQVNAARYAGASLADGGFIVPVLPTLPAVRGQWQDWHRNSDRRDTVLRHGRPPDFLAPHRLGGYDKLFRWRDPEYRNEYGREEWRDGTGQRRNVRGNLIGGKTVGDSGMDTGRSGGYFRPVISRQMIGYRTYGPFEWMRRRVRDYWWQNLRDSNFNEQFEHLSRTKLAYMFNPGMPLERIHYPQWHTDYPSCVQMAGDGARVTYTLLYKVSVRSRYPKDHPQFMSAGSFQTNADNPQSIRGDGWVDPARWNIPKIADHVWEDQWQYETTQDMQIGISGRRAANGDDEWFPVYMIDRYVFGGIDVGGEWPIENPANYASTSELPAPYMLDTSGGDYDPMEPGHDQGVRRRQYTYLAAAHRSARPMVWAERFGTTNPIGRMAAVSQVQIYNPTSWDLWTQDWRAQLVPVTGLVGDWGAGDDWVGRMQQGRGDVSAVRAVLRDDDLHNIMEYFSRMDPAMLEVLLNH